ncbi:MAG: hypothetical protein Q9201_001672 [Fulgogasparrea decipioides]
MYDKERIRPDPSNVGAAAVFLNTFLATEWPTGEFAIAGGFAMILHGSARATYDVDICANGQDLNLLLHRMMLNRRFILPSKKLFSDVIQFYVKTGPSFGDTFPQLDRAVKVEFLLGGGLQAQGFQQHRMNIPYRGSSLVALDVMGLLKSKLAAFAGREENKDYLDIKELIRRNGALIQGQNQTLNQDHVAWFIQGGMQGNAHEQPQVIQQAKITLGHP